MDCCAFSGQENIVQLLLDAEVEVDPKDIRGVSYMGGAHERVELYGWGS